MFTGFSAFLRRDKSAICHGRQVDLDQCFQRLSPRHGGPENSVIPPEIRSRFQPTDKRLCEVTQFVAFDAVGTDAQRAGLDAEALKLMTQPVKHRV